MCYFLRNESNVNVFVKLKVPNDVSSGAATKVIKTDGGRFDVRVAERQRVAVYWDDPPNIVRRCSWFFRRSLDPQYIPYEEDMALKLEEQYRTVQVALCFSPFF